MTSIPQSPASNPHSAFCCNQATQGQVKPPFDVPRNSLRTHTRGDLLRATAMEKLRIVTQGLARGVREWPLNDG
jgi:hypothetical protein